MAKESTDNLVMQKFKATIGGQRLSADDLTESGTSIVCFSQWERFHNETVALTSGRSKVKRESPIYKFDPVNEEGFLELEDS